MLKWQNWRDEWVRAISERIRGHTYLNVEIEITGDFELPDNTYTIEFTETQTIITMDVASWEQFLKGCKPFCRRLLQGLQDACEFKFSCLDHTPAFHGGSCYIYFVIREETELNKEFIL